MLNALNFLYPKISGFVALSQVTHLFILLMIIKTFLTKYINKWLQIITKKTFLRIKYINNNK